MDIVFLIDLIVLIGGHPLTWMVGAFALASMVTLSFAWLLESLGLGEADDGGILWARLLIAEVFSLIMLGGVVVVATSSRAHLLASLAGGVFHLLLSLVSATVLLTGGHLYGQHRLARSTDPLIEGVPVETEVRWVRLALGVLAALAVVRTAMFPLLLVIGVGAGVAWLSSDAPARAWFGGRWRDLQAGQSLRRKSKPDAVIDVQGRRIALLGRFGLFETMAMDGDELVTLANTELLQVVLRGQQLSG